MASQVEKEKKRWERKHKSKPVLAERIKSREIKEMQKHKDNQSTGKEKMFTEDL